MHVGVIELLRCPVGHEESALVASATRQVDRRIVEGSLGCPVCGAEYPIRGAVADFQGEASSDDSDSPAAQPRTAPNEEATIRLAAQLDLTQPGRLVLLAGEYCAAAPALSVMFDALCIAVGAPAYRERHLAEHASVMRIGHVVPLARSSLHGAAIDVALSDQLGLPHVTSMLKARGRLVAPAPLDLPSGVTLLARDAQEWVAVRSADTGDVVPIKRAPR